MSDWRNEVRRGSTARGFGLVEFPDRYGGWSELQESSLATEDAIWLGPTGHRMHLGVEQVEWLVTELQFWLERRRLRDETDSEEIPEGSFRLPVGPNKFFED